jgi:hypothetical protein
MERVEEFSLEEKNFVYIDLSNIMTNEEFILAAAGIEPLIAKHPEKSLYTITNIENVRFDSRSKDVVAKYLEHNNPYVKYGAIFGIDGIKKMMVDTILKLSRRKNIRFVFTKEQAIEWLLKQD